MKKFLISKQLNLSCWRCCCCCLFSKLKTSRRKKECAVQIKSLFVNFHLVAKYRFQESKNQHSKLGLPIWEQSKSAFLNVSLKAAASSSSPPAAYVPVSRLCLVKNQFVFNTCWFFSRFQKSSWLSWLCGILFHSLILNRKIRWKQERLISEQKKKRETEIYFFGAISVWKTPTGFIAHLFPHHSSIDRSSLNSSIRRHVIQ